MCPNFLTVILFLSPVFPDLFNRRHDEQKKICKVFQIATVNSAERIELDLMFQEFMRLWKVVYSGFAKENKQDIQKVRRQISLIIKEPEIIFMAIRMVSIIRIYFGKRLRNRR